ncbi:MAG: UxaA family hydrolase [Cyclobacteriaceae bacterium]
MPKLLQIHPSDNCLVALSDLSPVEYGYSHNQVIMVVESIPAKHKVALTDLPTGTIVTQYGVSVGKTTRNVNAGEWLNTENLEHLADPTVIREIDYQWNKPDVSVFSSSTFMGFIAQMVR